ncbi:MAG: response regulator [Selenomonadaceae bacterium]|nr:response regulator [Selenomonadaceae bacterium]
MDKKILFISQGVSFMGNSIQRNLESAGYQVTRIDPTIEQFAPQKNKFELIAFYLGKFLEDIPDFLVYLKDACLEEDKILILLGNTSEIETIEAIIPEDAIAKKFERPIDLKTFASDVEHVYNRASARDEKKTILMVDDDPTFLKMMKGWLEGDYRVTIVTSGTQALMYIADNKPDLILLDYEMPVISGPQVLEMIRSESKVESTPVIFLTGKGDRESVMKVMELRPDGYLLKSLPREKILASVKEFFYIRRMDALKEKNSN